MRKLSPADLSFAPLLVAIALFVIFPITTIILGSASTPPRPGGFDQPVGALMRLISASLTTAGFGALIAVIIGTLGSVLSIDAPKFARLYKGWLVVLLFTNPVFFVLGLSTLLVSWPAYLSVTIATALIVLPLGGLIIQSAFDELPQVELRAARALGANSISLLRLNVLPAIAPQLMLAFVLTLAYALGFYLVPNYVGFGRVVTLSTSISTLASKVGDWPAALQISMILLGLQLVLLFIAALGSRLLRSGRHA